MTLWTVNLNNISTKSYMVKLWLIFSSQICMAALSLKTTRTQRSVAHFTIDKMTMRSCYDSDSVLACDKASEFFYPNRPSWIVFHFLTGSWRPPFFLNTVPFSVWTPEKTVINRYTHTHWHSDGQRKYKPSTQWFTHFSLQRQGAIRRRRKKTEGDKEWPHLVVHFGDSAPFRL